MEQPIPIAQAQLCLSVRLVMSAFPAQSTTVVSIRLKHCYRSVCRSTWEAEIPPPCVYIIWFGLSLVLFFPIFIFSSFVSSVWSIFLFPLLFFSGCLHLVQFRISLLPRPGLDHWGRNSPIAKSTDYCVYWGDGAIAPSRKMAGSRRKNSGVYTLRIHVHITFITSGTTDVHVRFRVAR